MSPTRRQYLAALSGSALVSLAGCSDGGSTTVPRTTTTVTQTTSVPTPPATSMPGPVTTTRSVDVQAFRADAQQFVRDIASGDFQAAIDGHSYTDQVAAQLDVATLQSLWRTQTSGLGTFSGIGDTQDGTAQGYHVVVVTATFTDGEQLVRLVYDGQGRIAGLQFPPQSGTWSPPDYVDPESFTETELTLQATQSCSLGATLTRPKSADRVPGVVLVQGSGPNDRDETIGPNKPFKDLAWGLATKRIAVLRYDKRTATCSVDPATLTIDEEVTDDALTAVERLREHERISSVAVVGHSLGAMLAPRIAARDGDLAAIAMLAAPARPLPTLVLQQIRYLAGLDGTVTDAEQRQIDRTRQAVKRIRALDIPQGETVLGGGRPYWRTLQAYDQVATAKALTLPRLFAQGGRDYQVTPAEDFQAWRDALSGVSNVRFEQYARLNHLFMAGSGQPNPEEYYRKGHVSPAVVEDLAGWLKNEVEQ
ncbi:MAG: DUF3887 domain-containing protein [Halapricum sp.]